MSLSCVIEKEFKGKERQDYVLWLNKNPKNLFYQNPNYHEHLKLQLDCELFYFKFWNVKELYATFPLMIRRSKKFGNVGNSLPYFGSNGCFAFKTGLTEDQYESIRRLFLLELEKFILKENLSAFTIITNPLQQEDSLFFENNFDFSHKDYRIGQITKLPSHSLQIEASLLGIFDNPRPRNIRKAIKSNVEVKRTHGLKALRFLFEIHKSNIESIGGKAKEFSFFEKIPQLYSEDEYAVYIATKEGRDIAGLLLFYFNETVEYFTPATIYDFRNDQPSSLIIFEAMKDASKRGFKNWNWGGTWRSQTGVYDFKKKWGAHEFEYKYYTRVISDGFLKDSNRKELVEAFKNFYLFPY